MGQGAFRRRPAFTRLAGRASLRVRLAAAALGLLAAGAAAITLAGGWVVHGYLMTQAGRQLRGYAAELASHSLLATPTAPAGAVPAGPGGVGAGGFGIAVRGAAGRPAPGPPGPAGLDIQLRGAAGQVMLRSGPASLPGPAAWAQVPRPGRVGLLPGAAGGSYLVVAEPIHYQARHIPYAYSAEDFSLVITSRAQPGLDGTLLVGLDTARLSQPSRQFLVTGLWVGGLALLAVGGLAAVALWAALRPVTRLTAAADDIAAAARRQAATIAGAGGAAATAGGSGTAADRLARVVEEVSLELRRPVSVLRGLAGSYRRHPPRSAGEQERLARRVAQEAARIDALTTQLRRCGQDVPGPVGGGARPQ